MARFPALGGMGNVEFHAHRVMQAKDEWRCLKDQVHEAVWICRSVVHAVVNSGARIHIQGVDVARLHARYRYPASPYQICLRHVLERVHDHCELRSETSTVTADILDECDQAAAVIAGYARFKTPGYRPTLLDRIQPMRYVDSAGCLGVQAADVVTYIARRHFEETDAHLKAKKAARQLFNAMRPNVDSVRKWTP
jgi:hypothetical protein